jgi:hypothetical protein
MSGNGFDSVRPFGRYGVGVSPNIPLVLLVVVAVILLTLVTVPESRLFFSAAVMVGGALGFVLWLRHR